MTIDTTTMTSFAAPRSRSWARYATATARILMGLLFTFTGLNGLLNFLPPPPPDSMPADALAFVTAIANTGYMMQLIGGTQLVAGVLLVTGLFVPLALVILAPVVVNIVALHIFLAPSGLAIAIIVLLLQICLMWAYRRAYRPLFAVR